MLKRISLRTIILLALVAYCLTLIWTLPAVVVWQRLEHRLPVPVTLHGLSGTLWSGQVTRMQVNGIDQGGLRWQWLPMSLLHGKLGLDLLWQPRNSKVAARVSAGFNSLKLSDITGSIDAASMAVVHNAPFVLRGTWLLDIPELSLRDFAAVTSADGRVVWQDAAGGLPQPLQLGHLTATLGAAQDRLVLALQDAGGPLGLQGDARWQPGQPMLLDVRLQARPDAERGLVDGLGLLGRPDAQGWVHWQQQLQ